MPPRKSAPPPTRGKRIRRGNDRDAAVTTRLAKLPVLWRAVRGEFPESVREMVDALALEGVSISLEDLKLLAFACERTLAVRGNEAYERTEGGARSLASMYSVQLQFQKHMRVLVQLQGPSDTLNDTPVRVPEGMSFAEMAARLQRLGEDEILS